MMIADPAGTPYSTKWSLSGAIPVLLVTSMICYGTAAETFGKKADSMAKIKIVVDNKTSLTAILDDTAAAQDFLSLLPLKLTLEDYNNTEKVSDLPRPISTDGAAEGIDPQVGDITYYAPWGNLAIFYRDFSYAKGLVRLGHISSGIEKLEMNHAFSVTIQRAE